MADSKTDAPFVFEGSVKSVSDSNVSAVPADATTAVVQVDHVRLAPRALAGFAGKDITLRMASKEKVAAGDKAVFFADGLVYGDHLAVQSLGHDPMVAMEAKAALAGATPVVQKLRQRMDEAHAVVSGQVKEVRPVRPAPVKARAAAAPGASVGRISEHEPFWHEAVIEVSGVHKGPKQKRVVVRFPTSTDVKWRNAPQFKKGQKGIWFLHALSAASTTARAGAALKAVGQLPAAGFYTALDPNDFHPASEASVVQAMLPATAPAAKKSAVTRKGPSRKRAAAKASARARGRKGRH